jgi:hypothetical protein
MGDTDDLRDSRILLLPTILLLLLLLLSLLLPPPPSDGNRIMIAGYVVRSIFKKSFLEVTNVVGDPRLLMLL